MDFQMKIVVQFSWKEKRFEFVIFFKNLSLQGIQTYIFLKCSEKLLFVTYSVDLGREQLQAEALVFDCNHYPEDAHRDAQLVDHFVVEVLEDLKAVLGEVLDQEAVKNAILFNTTIIAKYVQRTIGR